MELKGLTEQWHLFSFNLLKTEYSVSICCTQYVLFVCYFKEKNYIFFTEKLVFVSS